MAGERTLKVTILGDADSAVRAIGRVEQASSGLSRSFGRVRDVAGGFLAANAVQMGTSAVVGFLGDAKNAASDLNESMNAVNSIFGESADEILAWGDANATAFGLSQRAFNQMATPLGAMLKNSGLAMEDVEKHTIDLTMRAADLASVFNTDVEDALSAIQAGLRGELDPLERYGVRLSAAAVQQRALADTGKEAAASLTEQEKAAARLALIYEQTESVAGDFAATSGEVANAERIATAEIEELQAQIGQHLLPLTLKITQAKLALVKVLAEDFVPALDSVANFVGNVVEKLEAFIGAVNRAKNAIEEIPVIGGAAERIPDVSGGGILREGIDKLLDVVVPGKGLLGALGVPGADNGGIVGGLRGSPQLILAHGGETILPTHKSPGAGGITINIFGSPITTKMELQRMIKEGLADANRRGPIPGVS